MSEEIDKIYSDAFEKVFEYVKKFDNNIGKAISAMEIDRKISKWQQAIEDIIVEMSQLTNSEGLRFNSCGTEREFADASIKAFSQIRDNVVHNKPGEYIVNVPDYLKSEDK